MRYWKDNVDWLLNDYVPKRTNIVLQQFRDLGIYPNLKAPVFLKDGKK